ncbi:helix-turn-helix transcriptional regulator [Tateyamaria omphalii]|uniref:helix-turn-helix transcriptional regulator n=1 Tax=Tateyamaria omphalii TaxID=299262 RepID=UPI001C9960D1|nr:helix-turn-helix transcriptional regulator [Tateyamaria omphalii]MBY5933986.1 helix-turn-helix transcriptional regulator [Tateyamaria omphalii]
MDPNHFHFDLENLRVAAATGLLVLSAFCAHLLLLPDRHRRVRLPLALFFLATALEMLAIPVALAFPVQQGIMIAFAFELAEVPLTMCKPFLLWLYVSRLTHDPTQEAQTPNWAWHGLPIGFATVLYFYILLLPASQKAGLHPEATDLNGLQTAAILGLYAATVIFFVLLPIYAILILQRLSKYRSRLKDLFASTENRELAWAWWLAALVIVFWCFNVITLAVSLVKPGLPGFAIFDTFLAAIVINYVLMWSIALWGTRQRPGIEPPATGLPTGEQNGLPMRKYGKSGLSDDRLDRIAGKIEALMRDERLFLEPDLSLWDLANRIGVTTHYASQALNEKIGVRFFDYVNRWRIHDATDRLRDTDATILEITYDVGFNSRSSFYTAFKRELGMTPSQYRKGA